MLRYPSGVRVRSKTSLVGTLLTFVIVVSVTGCGGSSNSNSTNKESMSKKNESWLSDWSPTASAQAKEAFGFFKLTKDSFEKEYYFNLPDDEVSRIKINKPVFEFSIYSGKPTQNEYLPFLIVAYLGNDWQFYNGLKIKFGEEVREFELLNDPDRNTHSGMISEVLSFSLSKEDAIFLSQVFTLGNPDIRLTGTEVLITDIQLTELELENLKKVLLAYKYIVNKNIKPS